MPFDREKKQILSTIKLAGNKQRGFIKTYKTDPMSGGYVPVLNKETYFAQSSMSSNDFSSQALANGLFKLLIPAVGDDMVDTLDFNKLVTDKSIKFLFPDGREVNIINVKLTCPDGVTPVLARLYVGA